MIQREHDINWLLKWKDRVAIRDYLSGIYNAILLKGVVKRTGILDIAALERLVRFLFDNIGNLSSVKGIADTLSPPKTPASPPSTPLVF